MIKFLSNELAVRNCLCIFIHSINGLYVHNVKCCVIYIFRYYEFDDGVVRELLGKKLTAKHRKDLDEVAEKTKIALKSCRYDIINAILYDLLLLFTFTRIAFLQINRNGLFCIVLILPVSKITF